MEKNILPQMLKEIIYPIILKFMYYVNLIEPMTLPCVTFSTEHFRNLFIPTWVTQPPPPRTIRQRQGF